MNGDALGGLSDEQRLAELVDVVVAIASNDFTRRAHVGNGDHLADGLATGLNMLAEEFDLRQTRERALQQRMLQQERLIAVGQLAAGVAHEINTPAASSLADLEALEHELAVLLRTLPAGDAELVRVLQRLLELAQGSMVGVKQVAGIVRDLRGFAHRGPERTEALPASALLQDALRLVQHEVRQRARLHVRAEGELRVWGDRTKLVQVLTNLLMNASQSLPEGDPDAHQVEVRAVREGGMARITVRDTGCGLSPEVRAHLFEPFYTTKANERGLGLGLAISADIVRQHGGELLLVDSSPAGTTFEVRLPIATAAERAAVPQAASEARGAERPRLMIVDDEPMLLEAYSRFYGAAYDITLVPGGHAAIAHFERGGDWDAILCDIMMPGIDAQALREWLLTHRPELEPRLLFSTGGAFTPRSDEFVSALGGRVLQKPFSAADLHAAVERVRAGVRPPGA